MDDGLYPQFLVVLSDEKVSGIDSEVIALSCFSLQTHDWVQLCDQTQSGLCLQKHKVNLSISHSEDCCLQKADNQYSFGKQAYWKAFKLVLRKKKKASKHAGLLKNQVAT